MQTQPKAARERPVHAPDTETPKHIALTLVFTQPPTLEPDGAATGCNPVEVGRAPAAARPPSGLHPGSTMVAFQPPGFVFWRMKAIACDRVDRGTALWTLKFVQGDFTNITVLGVLAACPFFSLFSDNG
jgi:hypothetical protein